MIYHNIAQGSQEWHELRANFFTASEAPAMMGASPKVRRTELLRMKAIGSEREFSDWVQRNLFDKGHEYEALARPIIEDTIGDELFPTTGTKEIDGLPLLASFDGLTMLSDVVYEHKMWNESLAQSVRDNTLSDEYKWQLDQQLLLSEAEKAIFVVSDGTAENMVYMEYLPDQKRFKSLLAGWKQFQNDLSTFEAIESKPEPVGKTPDNLPALRIEMRGEVSSSNLSQFRDHALAVLSTINRELKTDQDFADAEKTVKWCAEVEAKLKATKDYALSQTASIEEAFRVIDDVSDEVRRIRLELDKLVKAEKENIRNQIRVEAIADFNAHIKSLNDQLKVVTLPEVPCDVVSAMKGKRTVATLTDAAKTTVANAKVVASQLAEKITARLALIDELGKDYPFLFIDKQQLVQQDDETLKMLINARITQHQEQLKADAKAAIEREKHAAQIQHVQPVLAEPHIDTVEPAPWQNESTASDYVSISRKEYEQLLEDSELLNALHRAGVDNWDGWDFALSLLNEVA